MGQEESTNRDKDNEEWISQSAKDDVDNRSNQLNPNNDSYWTSRGYSKRPDDWKDRIGSQLPRENDDNRSDQLNPNNPKYWWSRDEQDSSTSVVPFSPSEVKSKEFQFEIDKELITTGIEIAYGVYKVHEKISNMVEERRDARKDQNRRRSSSEGLKDFTDGIELAANIGFVAYGGYKLYNQLSEGSCKEKPRRNRH